MKAAVAAIPIAIATTTTSMAKAAAATNSETKEAAPVAASFFGLSVRRWPSRNVSSKR